MVRNTRKIGLIATAVAVLLSAFSPVVFAGGADVGSQPAYPIEGNTRSQNIFIMTLKPGETGKNGIRLINTGKEAHTLQIYPVDGSTSVDGSFSCKQKSEDRKEVGTWVSLSEEEVTIKPQTQLVVDFTVTVPDGTNPGEHNGCIAIQDLEDLPATSGEGVLLGIRQAKRLAITVPGKITKEIEFIRLDVDPNRNDLIVVTPVAKNTGNVSLDMKTYAQLVSMFGQKSELKENDLCPIVPGATSTTSCSSSFERPYWGGIYKARTSISYNSNVTEGLGVKPSQPKRISMTSSYFISWPDPTAAAAELAVLLAVLWLVTMPLRRRLRRKRVIRKWEKYVVQDGDTVMTIAAARGAKWRALVRHNRLKAPYTLTKGQAIIVPKMKDIGGGRPKRRRRSELDWVLEADPVTKNAQAEQTANAQNQPPRPAHPTSSGPRNDWVSPRESTWTAPGSSIADEPEDDYDENYVDWREGAEPDELETIEQRIGDYTAVPQIRRQETSETSKSSKPKAKKATKSKRPNKPKKRT